MKTYNHYIDGQKVATYSQAPTKRKRTVSEQIKHNHLMAALKDTAIRFAIVLTATGILAVIFLNA